MKMFVLILIISIAQFGFSQIYTDIALNQGITNVQFTPDEFANGMTFYDFDEDGWDDLTFPAQNDSLIFYKNINGNFQKIGSMLYADGNPRSILWVDYDNDLDLDLCITYTYLGLRIYQNDGSFNFTDVSNSAGISTVPSESYGTSFADADADGDLDIYLCNYISFANLPPIYRNQFYVNQGDGTFIEMGISAGIDNGLKTTFMGVWYDYNEDDIIDLHVINDRDPHADALYLNNDNGTFTDVASSTGVLNQSHDPMGISIADYNNDGFQDAFVSDAASGTIVSGLPLAYKLYTNQNGISFNDVAPTVGLDTNLMAWGGLWVDYDNDGFEDLYVATSRLNILTSTEETSLMYKNEQGLDFTLMNDSIQGDILSSAYSPVKGDINNDGFYDIVVLNGGVPSNVFENSGNSNNYIKITPVGTISNQKAIGAKVRVFAAGFNQYQTVMCGSGICSQNSQHMIFGIGNKTIVDSVVITFPSGIVVRQYNLQVGTDYTIVEKPEIIVELIPGTSQVTLCQGDSISIGSTLYTNFLWNTGSSDSLITVTTDGVYSFVADNMAGDTLFRSTELTVTFEQSPLYQTITNNSECGLGNLGSATLLFISPPSSFFDIEWSNGDTGITIDSVGQGTYTATFESNNSCIFTGSVTITETPLFDAQFITSPVTNDTSGTVQFFIFGGTPPFQYELNNVLMGPLITDLNPGNYIVIITDSNGCEVSVPFSIIDESINGLNEGTIDNYSIYINEGTIWVTYSDIEQLESLTVQSITGEVVATKKDGEIDSNGKWKSTLPFAQGIYLIIIKSKGRVLVKRAFIY